MQNEARHGEEAIAGILRGMDTVNRAVSRTMGAAGRNVVFSEYGKASLTNDGVTVAKKISPKDVHESMGASWITQPARRTEEEAGDGTSTAILLSHALATEGLKKVRAGVNPMKLKSQMDAACRRIVAEIKESSRPIKTDEELLHIAKISVEDDEVARIIRDSAKHAGIDGTVIVDESTGLDVEKEEIAGMKYEKGYISPYMVTDPERMEAVMKDVHILMTDKALNMVNDFFPLWEDMTNRGVRQMLVIAEDVSGELLASFIATRHSPQSKTHFLTVATKKPYHKDFLEDIAVFTGGQTLTEEKGIKQFLPEHFSYLGKADKVIVNKDRTVIIGGHGDKARIDERIAGLKSELKKAETYEKNQIKDRIARLIGGIVIIRVGAPTEAEMKYKKRKIDDAVAATRAAMEEGIVVGGGRTLYDISLVHAKDDGEDVIRRACAYPIKKIIENAGEEWTEILPRLNKGEVFNALTGEITKDPIADGIIDPAKVERCALTNAVSFASSFLTTDVALVDLPEQEPNQRIQP